MSSRRDAVLQIAELLQEILLQLDMRTLLTAAQLVSRQWRELITSSPALQQALYLAPAAQTSGPATRNPLLAELFPLWFPGGEPQKKPIGRADFETLPMASKSRLYTFMRPSATWRRMLVRQPPILNLGCWNMSHRFPDLHHFYWLEYPGGLRMDTLYDSTQDWFCQRVSGFNVFWDPSVVPGLEYAQFDRESDSEKADELESLIKEVDVIVFHHDSEQYWSPSLEFQLDFTFH